VGALFAREGVTREGVTPDGDTRQARGSGLESEIQLVDAMRQAVQRDDTSALRSLVESYRGTFPEGQLRQEVSELALHVQPTAR